MTYYSVSNIKFEEIGLFLSKFSLSSAIHLSSCRHLGEITRRFHPAKDVEPNFRARQSGKAIEANIWSPPDLITFPNNRLHVKGYGAGRFEQKKAEEKECFAKKKKPGRKIRLKFKAIEGFHLISYYTTAVSEILRYGF